MSSLISFHCYIFTSFLSSQPGPHFLLCLLYHYPSQSLSCVSFPFCNSYFFPTSCSSSCFPLTFFPFLSISYFPFPSPPWLIHSFIPLFFSHCLLSISTTLLFYPPCHSHVPLFIILDCFSLRFLPSYTLSYLFQSFCHSLFCFIFCFSIPSFPFKALNSELLLKRLFFFQLLIKRRFNTIKCHLLPVGTQQ